MSTTKPTIVLTPGAWHTPEVYSAVVELLSANGYPVINLPLPSVGAVPALPNFDQDVDAIRKSVSELVIEDEKEVVVVVHSYGGLPGGEALKGLGSKERESAGLRGGVIRYIVISGYAVPAGFNQIAAAGGSLDAMPDWIDLDLQNGIATVSPANAKKIFYHDIPSVEKQEKLVSQLRHQSLGVYSSTATYAAWVDIPSTFLVGDKDRSSFSPEVVAAMIQGAQQIQPSAFDVVEHCEEGGHCLMASFPEWTANAIRRAAGETLK